MEKDFEKEVLERLIKIETKLDDYTSIKEKAESSYVRSLQNEKDIAEMKDNNKWIIRTLIGEFITIIGGAIALYLNLK